MSCKSDLTDLSITNSVVLLLLRILLLLRLVALLLAESQRGGTLRKRAAATRPKVISRLVFRRLHLLSH